METPSALPDYPALLRRNAAWIAAPVLAVATVGAVGAFLWPDTYLSQATLRIAPAAARDSVLPEGLASPLADRVAAMQQSILSRNTLTALIETQGLYRAERARVPLEDVIERMRRDIAVAGLATAPGGGAAAHRTHVFRVAFSYPDRFAAHRVTQNLASRFLDENTRERGRQIESVNQFLRDNSERAAVELAAVEAKLAAFRRTGAAAPDAPGFELPRLALLETRGSAADASLGRARQEMALLEGELRAARNVRTQAPSAAPIRPPQPSPLEAELDRLLTRYKPSHPDVVRLRALVDAAPKAALKGNQWLLGETIELVDAASLPETPVAPNRFAAIAAAAALGLLLAGAIVALREWNDDALKTVRQVRDLAALKILGSIPLLESDMAVRRRKRVAVVAWAAASAGSLAAIAASATYHYRRL